MIEQLEARVKELETYLDDFAKQAQAHIHETTGRLLEAQKLLAELRKAWEVPEEQV
jgi:regulator of replication initiation timing